MKLHCAAQNKVNDEREEKRSYCSSFWTIWLSPGGSVCGADASKSSVKKNLFFLSHSFIVFFSVLTHSNCAYMLFAYFHCDVIKWFVLYYLVLNLLVNIKKLREKNSKRNRESDRKREREKKITWGNCRMLSFLCCTFFSIFSLFS